MPGRVVHCRREAYDKYVGRPSLLGNPFYIGPDGTREEVIAKHRKYTIERMEHDIEFRNEVMDCKDKVLGCWCHPLPCHAWTYIELANQTSSKENG
jgi:uncharacterized protein DUF4326